LKHYLVTLLILFPICLFASDTYRDILKNKKGSIDVYYYNSDHFISDASGNLNGIEYDLFLAFQGYLKSEGLEVEINFIKADDFYSLYDGIKNGSKGDFGACSFSITPSRLTEVGFSPKYMPDIEVLICSQNVPIVTDTAAFLKQFSGLTALTVANTTFDEDIQKLAALIPNLKIEQCATAGEIRQRIATEENLFSYIELPNYLVSIAAGSLLKRQSLFKNERWGYGIIFPQQSDWSQAINGFFDSPLFKDKMNLILQKHLGKDIQDLLWEVGNSNQQENNQEIALLTKEREIQNLELIKNSLEAEKSKLAIESADRTRNLLIGVVGLAFLVILLGVFAFRAKRKATIQLEVRNKEIEDQKIIIEEKNKDITDSIVYAKNIQNALLPDVEILKEKFQDHFLYFKPRDIVSGDFYWFAEIEDTTIVVLADCTGHGVPGAMVSMMGCNYLNQIINDDAVTSPASALTALDDKVTKALQNTNTQSRDGMDIVMIAFNSKENKLTFSGGKNNIYRLRAGEFTKFKGDKFSIGSDGNTNKQFTDQVIEVVEGDLIYAFTDGFVDQFGGDKGKKLKVKSLLETLKANGAELLSEQHKALDTKLINWMGSYEQVDDISVLGIRI
jgi:serine phosphatase RsbU (regulator of sigma subunit)